jgi:4-amino-4-deoxy-L-arabinose transferase-like glycosyltransferase
VAILWLFVVGALLLRVAWMLHHGRGEISWDGAEYARTAQNLLAGHGYIGIRGHENFVFPPLYSLAIAALLPFTHDGELAGTIVSLIAGALLVLPAFHLAANYGRRAGYAAAGLAAVLPFTVELSTTVLADALYLTLATTGLALLARTARGRRVSDAAWCGAAFAAAYLTRPEGVLFEGLAVAVVIVAALLRTMRPARAGLLAVALLVPFVVAATPYAWFLSSHAGHLRIEGKSVLNLDIGLRMSRGMDYAAAADAIDRNLQQVGPELADDYYLDPPGRTAPPLSTLVAFGASNTLRHVPEIFAIVKSRTVGGPLLMLLALLGLACGPWTRRRAGFEAIMLAYGALVVLSLASVFHFWERYFVGFVPLVLTWGGRGIDVAMLLTARAVPRPRAAVVAIPVLVGLLLVAAVFSIREGFTDDSTTLAERAAGVWLAAHGGAGATMLGISDQSVYYAGGVWVMLPTVPDDETALRYVALRRPAYVILDREYAADRPYVSAWLDRGIPDRRAHEVYMLGDRPHPTLAIYAWRSP